MRYSSAFYDGAVVHARKRPRAHRLQYNVFSMLFDLEELQTLDQRLPLFGYNRRNIVSFFDCDHGDGTGRPLRAWVECQLQEAGIEFESGAVRLLCYPRLLGYVFNPLSVYFCYDKGERLHAVLYEVGNTFGERHVYALPVNDEDGPVIRQSCEKAFYVSPFLPMDCRYHFRVMAPGENVSVVIRQDDKDGPVLAASFTGVRRSITPVELLKSVLRFPFLTFKVIAAIHWEALKLWLKKLPVYYHPQNSGHLRK